MDTQYGIGDKVLVSATCTGWGRPWPGEVTSKKRFLGEIHYEITFTEPGLYGRTGITVIGPTFLKPAKMTEQEIISRITEACTDELYDTGAIFSDTGIRFLASLMHKIVTKGMSLTVENMDSIDAKARLFLKEFYRLLYVGTYGEEKAGQLAEGKMDLSQALGEKNHEKVTFRYDPFDVSVTIDKDFFLQCGLKDHDIKEIGNMISDNFRKMSGQMQAAKAYREYYERYAR